VSDDLRGRAIAAMKSLGRRGRTSRVPMPVREHVLAYVAAARQGGRPWRDIAGELDLSATVLQRWQNATANRVVVKSPALMLPVVVRDTRTVRRDHEFVTLVTPSGLRVEGLAIAQAAELVRLLS
jgi:hypothetical protein